MRIFLHQKVFAFWNSKFTSWIDPQPRCKLMFHSPKAPLAFRMLSFVLQSIGHPCLAVPQPLSLLPSLLLHHTPAHTLNKENTKNQSCCTQWPCMDILELHPSYFSWKQTTEGRKDAVENIRTGPVFNQTIEYLTKWEVLYPNRLWILSTESKLWE